MSVSTQAAHAGSFGLQAVIDDKTNFRAYDYSPVDETHYRARFYFDPNSLVMASGSDHYIFEIKDAGANIKPFRLRLYYESGQYKLRSEYRNDAGTATNGTKIGISDDWHAVEMEW